MMDKEAQYRALVDAFRKDPSIDGAKSAAGCGWRTARTAWENGKWGHPPIKQTIAEEQRLRRGLAGASFAGNIDAPIITASVALVPTGAQDIRLLGEAGQGACKNAAGTLQPFAVAVSTDADHALNTRYFGHASAMMTTPLAVGDAGEAAFAFDTEEYDNNSLWAVANGDRMAAPATGYYHVSLWGKLIKGAVTLTECYVALKHSADGRILTKDCHVGDWTGTADGVHMACSIDVYLTAGQYVNAVVYQDSSVGALTVIGRMSMHRIP